LLQKTFSRTVAIHSCMSSKKISSNSFK